MHQCSIKSTGASWWGRVFWPSKNVIANRNSGRQSLIPQSHCLALAMPCEWHALHSRLLSGSLPHQGMAKWRAAIGHLSLSLSLSLCTGLTLVTDYQINYRSHHKKYPADWRIIRGLRYQLYCINSGENKEPFRTTIHLFSWLGAGGVNL